MDKIKAKHVQQVEKAISQLSDSQGSMHDSVIDANDMRFDQDSVIQSGRKEKKKNTERSLLKMTDPSTISDPKLGALVCESKSETESIKSSQSLPDSESD